MTHDPVETTEKFFSRTKSRSRQNKVRFFAYFLILILFIWFSANNVFKRFENMALDAFLKYGPTASFDPDILLIEISDSSIKEIGDWPWPRRYFAVMAQLLDKWKAKAIIFDFSFHEPTTSDDDLDLFQSFEKTNTPIYISTDLKRSGKEKIWIHDLPIVLDPDEKGMEWYPPLPELEGSVRGVGHRYLKADHDGIFRRIEPLLSYNEKTYPSSALYVGFDVLGEEYPDGNTWKRKLDNDGKLVISWSNDLQKNVSRYDYDEIIRSFYAIQKGMTPLIPPGEFNGKICFIGLTSEEYSDFKITPLGGSVSSIETQAQILNNVLKENWIIPVSPKSNLIVLFVMGLTTIAAFIFLRSSISLIVCILLGVSWTMFCFLVFIKTGLWFYVVCPVALILTLFVFSAIYNQLIVIKEKTHLFHLATRDGLTDLFVIRHFRLIMNQIVREAWVKKEAVSIILMDIDNFKKVNDAFGHPAGDFVLKRTAQIVQGFIRSRRPFRHIDFAARYGGEEFIVMLRRTKAKHAANLVAERIRKKIEEESFIYEEQKIPITLSLGVSSLRSNENIPDAMVRRADKALYQAKHDGKNRVCLG